ncbi:MAG: STAS domain-containing protein [Negativicutes bacterium]|nr:STAS domain-containing protein [Negativicutes bacterium]
MKYKAEEADEVIKIKLSGNIYSDEAAHLRETIMKYIDQGKRQFEFDFSEVMYVDSSGLGVLIAVHKRLSTDGGEVRINGLQGVVKEVFELTQLDKVFTIG